MDGNQATQPGSQSSPRGGLSFLILCAAGGLNGRRFSLLDPRVFSLAVPDRSPSLTSTTRSPPEITESFLALAPWFCANMDGQGDGTGEIPDPVVDILEDYFVGSQDRVKEYRAQHAAALRFRCERALLRLRSSLMVS